MITKPTIRVIAVLIKTRRIQLEMTQAQLAASARTTPACISQIEAGLRVPSLPVMIRIANALGASMDYLVGRSDKVKGGRIRA